MSNDTQLFQNISYFELLVNQFRKCNSSTAKKNPPIWKKYREILSPAKKPHLYGSYSTVWYRGTFYQKDISYYCTYKLNIIADKMKNKNKDYHIVGNSSKSNRKIPHCRNSSKSNRKIPHCRNSSKFNRKIPHCRNSSKSNRKYPTVGNSSNSNRKIPHCRNSSNSNRKIPHCRK